MHKRLGRIVLSLAAGAVCLGWVAHAQNPAGEKKGPAGSPPGKSAARPGTRAAAPPANTEQSADTAGEREIRDSAEAFAEAYNAHDAKGLAALFAPRAEFVDEDGRLIRGRDEIEKGFSELFQARSKATIQIEVRSVRLLTPNIGIEEGIVRGIPVPDEPPNISSYVAVHVKVDGKWLVGSVRDFEAPASAKTAHDHLRELSWLVGDWVDESPESTIHTSCRWADNGNFLLQDFTVRMEGRTGMSGSMRIGWDPLTQQFRSWVFDTQGGYAEGTWTREGNEWIVKSRGVTPAGETASATNVYRFVDRDTFTWRSHDRILGGQLAPGIDEVVIKRRAPAPMQ